MPGTAKLTEKLRSIDRDAWAEVENPGRWTYHTNIGLLVHEAADRIEQLESMMQGLEMTKWAILIGGITYTVSVVDNLRDSEDQLDGQIKYCPYSIELDSRLGKQGERVTLWHEVLHGILHQAGIEHDDGHEQMIDALAYGIVQVLQDNTELRG